MTESKMLQAIMLALTQQNVLPRPAPMSTQIKAAQCINRNIKAWEPVVVYHNDSGELQRVGDVPAHSGDFFIDEDNRMYSYDSTNHVLVIRDGLSGEMIGNTTPAYQFNVYNGGNCAAFKSREDTNTWTVIYPDGEMSNEITFDVANSNYIVMGYRNGILGVSVSNGGYSSPNLWVYTYTKSGTRLNEMAAPGGLSNYVYFVCPINAASVGIAKSSSTGGLFDFTEYWYQVLTIISGASYNPWDGYDTNTGTYVDLRYTQRFLWADQAYIYTDANIYEDIEVEGVIEHVFVKHLLGRFSIDNYNGLEEIADWTDMRYLATPPTPYGSFIQQRTVDNETIRQMMQMSNMVPIYAGELPELPYTAYVRENVGWIWIDGYGVFQKTRHGWLMYPSSTYPRSSPWGMLGYAVHDVEIGRTGLANIVFE